MKKSKVIIIALICVVLVLGGAALGFFAVSPKSKENTPSTTAFQNTENADDQEKATTNSKPAADFTVTDIEGNEVELSDLRGKPVVITAWTAKNKDCIEEMEYLNSLSAEYENRVNFLTVNLNDEDNIITVKGVLLEYGFNLPVYLDSNSEMKKAYNIKSVPASIFIDSNGSVFAEYTGLMNEAMIRGYVEKMLK